MKESTVLAFTSNLTFRWLLLLVLTILVAFSPNNSQNFPILYVVIWSVTLFKGWIIIEDFMELKEAPVFLRRIIYSWLIIATSAITLTAIYS